MEELEKWYEQISSYEKLSITDAQELYKKSLNTNDELLKKTYLDKIVLGTLYVVYNYIKRNNLELFISSSHDMDDIINAFSEVWIKKIHSGELLNISAFSSLFNSSCCNEFYTNLCGEEILVDEQFGITKEMFSNILALYIEFKNNGGSTSFIDVLKEKYYDTRKWDYYSYHRVVRVLPLIEQIYANLNFDKTDDLNLPITKINNYYKLFVSMGLIEVISDEFPDDDKEDEMLKKIELEEFKKELDHALPEGRRKQVLYARYGIDKDYPMILEEIGRTYGVTGERVRQLEKKAIKKLKSNKNIKKYKEL